MQKKQKLVDGNKLAKIVRQKLADHYPNAKTSLNYENPYQLFVATVLSAQTTDQQVNKITAALFNAFPKVDDLATAEPEILESYLKSCGLYRHKSRFLIAAGKIIVEHHGGKIPDNFYDLIKLPGVGRKTANVIISSAFGKPALAVDTHVFRVSKRIGLAGAGDVAGVEEQLKAIIPEEEWTATHHRLIRLGRSVCHARKPACHECFLPAVCCYARERGNL